MSGWTAWILASAVMLAFYDLAKKASVRNNAVLPTLLCSTIFGCAAFLTAAVVRGRFAASFFPGAEVLTLAFVKSLIVATSWIFTFSALRTLPVTIATPIRASAPAIVFLAAFFLYGERPSAVQSLGMALVFGGYFVFSWAGRSEGIDFLKNRAVWCAFAGMVFSACSALFDKFVFGIRQADVDAIQFWFQIDLIVVYAAILVISAAIRRLGRGRDGGVRFEWRWTIPLVGILLAAADWLYFNALASESTPISVASLLRRFSVVITFLLGARYFHETNLVRKGLALAIILAGVTLLII